MPSYGMTIACAFWSYVKTRGAKMYSWCGAQLLLALSECRCEPLAAL
jgi:hypothetical protein